MIVYWVFTHPDVVTYISRPEVADVAQLYALLTILAVQTLNYFVIGPITSKCVYSEQCKRHSHVKPQDHVRTP